MIGFIPECTCSQATLAPTQVEDHWIRPPGRNGSRLQLVFPFTPSFQVSAGFLLLLGDGRGQCLASVFWAGPTQKGSGCSSLCTTGRGPVLLPAQLHRPRRAWQGLLLGRSDLPPGSRPASQPGHCWYCDSDNLCCGRSPVHRRMFSSVSGC